MSRTNRKHNRQIDRHRRNKGPELFSRAADNELTEKAKEMAEGLSKATISHGNVAAAGLLLTLAECASYNENQPFNHTFSIADKWKSEPQVSLPDDGPQLPCPPKQFALTDGRPPEEATETDASAGDEPVEDADSTGSAARPANDKPNPNDEIPDAEFTMISDTPAPAMGAPS